jgi:hypothetical protein
MVSCRNKGVLSADSAVAAGGFSGALLNSSSSSSYIPVWLHKLLIPFLLWRFQLLRHLIGLPVIVPTHRCPKFAAHNISCGIACCDKEMRSKGLLIY